MKKSSKFTCFLLKITAYVCCYATSFYLSANVDLSSNEQLVTQINKHLKKSHNEFNHFLSDKTICVSVLPKCLNVKQIIKERKYYFHDHEQQTKTLIEFPKVINLNKLVKVANLLRLSNNGKKKLVVETSLLLNDLSTQWTHQQHKYLFEKYKLKLQKLPINNSTFIVNETNYFVAQKFSDFILPSDPFAIGILDSGISLYHQQMQEVKAIQFNPIDHSYDLKDTALGHGSGILSLLAVEENKEIDSGFLKGGKYFSCTGLPKGKYNVRLILKCMNWFFIQPRVDVLINAWLASSAGCKNEWQFPIAALIAAEVIPVFSAGNYATNKKSMNYSPANLILDNVETPLITVGALNKKMQRLETSSFGLSTCSNRNNILHYQANFFAQAENLKVAVPFQKNTYQMVSGTSYSVVEIASLIAKLKRTFPHKSGQQITQSLFNSTEKTPSNSIMGYGQLNYEKVVNLLSNH